jgi:hypothetical protein
MQDPKQNRIEHLEAKILRLRAEGVQLCREIVALYVEINGTMRSMVDIIPKD